jgi:hypothetical protein
MAMTNNSNPSQALTFDSKDPYPEVEARPLQMPDFVNLKPKNPAISFRWVNRSVGVQGSTQRLDEMIYAGFVYATALDVQGTVMPNLLKDGKIIRGDLVLMKMPKVQYEGALKYNWKRAVHRLHPGQQLNVGRQQLSKAVGEVGVPREVGKTLVSKLEAFRPNTAEIAKIEAEEDGTLPSERKEQ